MDKKYNIIYADPPWTYKVWSEKGTGRSAIASIVRNETWRIL
jgi:hypothetical protein